MSYQEVTIQMQCKCKSPTIVTTVDRGDGQDIALAVLAYADRHGVKMRAVDWRVLSTGPVPTLGALYAPGSPEDLSLA